MEPAKNIRPTVMTYDAATGKPTGKALAMPDVFSSPIRADVVQFVFANINKNKRQPHGVTPRAGHQTSAVSWGTGRAVARIPRVSGSGTGRSGQGAYGNMCRKGHMYSPKVTWRRWARKVPVTMKRHAVAAAVAASAVPALVQARGHHIGKLVEVPFVVDNEAFSKIEKTKHAVAFLKRFGLYDDVIRVISSKRLRPGKGKMRNRRYRMRKGPVLIYKEKSKVNYAFRNIPGVDLMSVERLNLLKLAPGGHLGRLVIWTKDAFQHLAPLFGSFKTASRLKRGFSLNRSVITNSDLHSIINSAAVQSQLKGKKRPAKVYKKRNPFVNEKAMERLNPQVVADKKAKTKENIQNRLKKKERMEKKRLRKKQLKEKKAEKKAPKKEMKTEDFKKRRKANLKKRTNMLKRKRLYVRSLLSF